MLGERVTAIGACVGRHDQHLSRTLEGMGEARRVGEITLSNPDAERRQIAYLLGVTDAGPYLAGRNTLDELSDNGPSELAAGSCDDDHAVLLMLDFAS